MLACSLSAHYMVVVFQECHEAIVWCTEGLMQLTVPNKHLLLPLPPQSQLLLLFFHPNTARRRVSHLMFARKLFLHTKWVCMFCIMHYLSISTFHLYGMPVLPYPLECSVHNFFSLSLSLSLSLLFLLLSLIISAINNT